MLQRLQLENQPINNQLQIRSGESIAIQTSREEQEQILSIFSRETNEQITREFRLISREINH